MRLDSVEIKTTIAGAQVDRALEAFGFAPGVVVASIPYYITSPILERLLEHKQLIARIVLLVQQEVADRLAARPSTDTP